MWIVNFMDYLVKVLTYFWLFGHNCVGLLRYHHFCYTNNFRIFPYPVISCASYSKFVKLLEAWNTIVRCNEFFIFILYRFLNIWPKCGGGGGGGGSDEAVQDWTCRALGRKQFGGRASDCCCIRTSKKEKNYIVASTRTSACSTEPWQTQPRTSKKGGENLTPPLSSLLSHSFFKKQHQNRNCPQNLW